MKKITVSHNEDAIETRAYCDPEPIMETPEVRFQLTYPEGYEQAALSALDRAYANLKRQVTGMTTVVWGPSSQDDKP